MHPPLERPHPDCQEAIIALEDCHRKTSKIFFWKCDDAKYALDKCFKKEKEDMLKRVNENWEDKRREEDLAFGQKISFEEFLKQDEERRRAKGEKV
mmetsp:Transcript_10017/g.12369  ORF Transcript_10017/g.12369 Transcript_10017/m.12369 type:complete len:96 (+) Transcript_10017:208-495(+)